MNKRSFFKKLAGGLLGLAAAPSAVSTLAARETHATVNVGPTGVVGPLGPLDLPGVTGPVKSRTVMKEAYSIFTRSPVTFPMPHRPIVPGTVCVRVGERQTLDDGSGKLIPWTDDSFGFLRGKINYLTGEIMVSVDSDVTAGLVRFDYGYYAHPTDEDRAYAARYSRLPE